MFWFQVCSSVKCLRLVILVFSEWPIPAEAGLRAEHTVADLGKLHL